MDMQGGPVWPPVWPPIWPPVLPPASRRFRHRHRRALAPRAASPRSPHLQVRIPSWTATACLPRLGLPAWCRPTSTANPPSPGEPAHETTLASFRAAGRRYDLLPRARRRAGGRCRQGDQGRRARRRRRRDLGSGYQGGTEAGPERPAHRHHRHRQSHEALNNGDLDANSFQHIPFLRDQIKQRGYKLVTVGNTLISPIAFYSRKFKSLEALPAGRASASPTIRATRRARW